MVEENKEDPPWGRVKEPRRTWRRSSSGKKRLGLAQEPHCGATRDPVVCPESRFDMAQWLRVPSVVSLQMEALRHLLVGGFECASTLRLVICKGHGNMQWKDKFIWMLKAWNPGKFFFFLILMNFLKTFLLSCLILIYAKGVDNLLFYFFY